MIRSAAALACLAIAFAPVWAATGSEAGRLPLAYRTMDGAYPWTGRLFAVGWQGSAPVPSPYLWEAGERLDRRAVSSRQVFTSLVPMGEAPERAIPLQWDAVAAALGTMGSPDPVNGLDRAALGWLRGDRTHASLRPRETRLGNAAGARVRVVAPPAWAPGKPGHSVFRARYSLRPHMVWLGTSDGLLHAFDAVSGEERAAYLPGVLLPFAAAMAATDAPLAPSPCPRPEAQDVMIRGEWRTVLLCAIPVNAKAGNPAAAFALDVSDPDGPMPFVSLWEIAATDVLPMTARGPVRAAGMRGPDGLRWFAVVTLGATGNDKAGAVRSGLALLPLDKPAGAGMGRTVRRPHIAIAGARLPGQADGRQPRGGERAVRHDRRGPRRLCDRRCRPAMALPARRRATIGRRACRVMPAPDAGTGAAADG
ncbi:hypothetical protein [Cupriavidus lacunae]|uniref:hypothetical protein n=1 Tax=Cupriavidus lacunae TaxID=2666307 RepID=UPI001FC995CE|nr:hypothetical protein [Cupriavidus lacunae]